MHIVAIWLSGRDRVAVNLRTASSLAHGKLFETFMQVYACQCI